MKWRRRSSQDKTITTTIVDDDPSRPTDCECGTRATVWASYLWRTKKEVGLTTEDMCDKHFHTLTNDPNRQVLDWGDL